MKLFFLMEYPIIQRYKVCTRVESKGQREHSYYKEEDIEIHLQETFVRILRDRREVSTSLSESTIEQSMSVQFGDFFNELELIVSEEGKIVCIENYEYIYHRFQDYLSNRVRNAMQDGEDDRLEAMDNMLIDRMLLLDFLHRGLFIYFFFHIYGYYPYNPVIGNREIPNFLGENCWISEPLEYTKTLEEDIQIEIEGHILENQEYLQLLKDLHDKGGANNIDVEFRGKFDISAYNIPLNINIMLETKSKQELFYKYKH